MYLFPQITNNVFLIITSYVLQSNFSNIASFMFLKKNLCKYNITLFCSVLYVNKFDLYICVINMYYLKISFLFYKSIKIIRYLGSVPTCGSDSFANKRTFDEISTLI